MKVSEHNCINLKKYFYDRVVFFPKVKLEKNQKDPKNNTYP